MINRDPTEMYLPLATPQRWPLLADSLPWPDEPSSSIVASARACLRGSLATLGHEPLRSLAPLPGGPVEIEDRLYGVHTDTQGLRSIVRMDSCGRVDSGPIGELAFPTYAMIEAEFASQDCHRTTGELVREIRTLYGAYNDTQALPITPTETCTVCSEEAPVGTGLCGCVTCGTLIRRDAPDWTTAYAAESGDYFRGLYVADGAIPAIGASPQTVSSAHGYEDYEEWARVILGRSHFDSRQTWIEQVTGRRSGRVLEVGCATGEMTAAFSRKQWTAAGIDLSPYCIDRARQLHVDCTFEVGTLREYSGTTPDVICYFDVFEHIRDPRSELELVLDRLRPGGDLILELPNQASVDAEVLGPHYLFAEHLYFYGPTQISQLLERNGFSVLAWSTTHDAYFRVDRFFDPIDANALLAAGRGERLLVAARRR